MRVEHISRKIAIVVAGGSGARMGSELPKQFLPLRGKPLLMYTLQRFHEADSTMELVLTLPVGELERWQAYCTEHCFCIPHRVVVGGETRFHSVLNALNTLTTPCMVAVHDGVRPFVSVAVITRCFERAAQTGAAIPVVVPVDSLRQVLKEGSKAVLREDYRLVQTPQVFDSALLKAAYAQPYCTDFTDDASVVERLGHAVGLVEGNRENIKITTPFDLVVAEALMLQYTM